MKHGKPKVLFFPFDLLSHYSRCVELAKTFGDKYEILFKSSVKYGEFIANEGFSTFDCADFDANYVMACIRNFSFKWLKMNKMEAIFAEQTKCIQEYQPLFVVSDMCPTLKMAAEYTNTHMISVINGYMSKYYSLQRPISSRHWAFPFQNIMSRSRFEEIVEQQEKKAFIKIHKPFSEIRRKYNLVAKSHYLDELEGDSTLICDDPEVFPQRTLPGNYKFIGPLLYSTLRSGSSMPARNGRKNILVTFGSSGEWHKVSCLNENRFAAFNIVTAGDNQRILNAPHIISLPFSSLDLLLPDTDLLICHGGNGTLNFAYKYKVPFIALPSIMEQEWNAYRFRDIGLGEVLATKKVKASALYTAILRFNAA